MASEIRVNKIANRAGLSTVQYTDTGIIVSGIVTCTEISGLNALNIAGVSTFASPLDINGDIDVDGHTNLDNLSVAGVSTFTGAVNTTNVVVGDFLNVGSNIKLGNAGVITATSYRGDGSQLTGIVAGLSTISGVVNVANDLDVDGHTNLDNVSIAGLSTHSEGIFIPDDKSIRIGNTFASPDLSISSSSSSEQVVIDYARSGTGKHLRFRCTDLMFENYNGLTRIARFQGGVGVGHAELYFAGNKKFETTNTGAIVSGVLTATSFSGDGSSLSNLPAGAPVGGASTNTVFFENDKEVAVNYQITSTKNAMTAGPVAINAGIAVTVPSGCAWTIV